MSTLRIFKHYIRIPFILLGLLEAIILVSSVYIGIYVRFLGDEYNLEKYSGEVAPNALVFAVVMMTTMLSMGLYQARMRDGLSGILYRLFIAYFLGGVVLAVIFYIMPELFLGRGILFFTFLFSFLSILLIRFALVTFDAELFKSRILVLGTGKKANAITKLRRKSDRIGFSIIGYVHLRGTKDEVKAENIIRLNTSLKDFAIANEIDEIILAVDDRRKSFPVHELLDCKMSGITILDIVSFFERETGKIHLDQIQPSWLMLNDGFKNSVPQNILKRAFDIGTSILMLVFTWPIMLITTLMIKIEDGITAPVFYRQIRLGEGGKPFHVLKFRSMIIDAEKNCKAKWASKYDDRITRVGRFIRKTRIDELPQIINVLRGDMSFVGPRPERPEFVVALSEKIPYYSERHRVRPGITGWAQICYQYGASETDAMEKLQYDLYYVKNYSIFLDLLILLQTAEVIIFGKGAR